MRGTRAERHFLDSEDEEAFAASFFSDLSDLLEELEEEDSLPLPDEALSDLEDEAPSPLLPDDAPSLLPAESPSPLFLAEPLLPVLPRPWSVV